MEPREEVEQLVAALGRAVTMCPACDWGLEGTTDVVWAYTKMEGWGLHEVDGLREVLEEAVVMALEREGIQPQQRSILEAGIAALGLEVVDMPLQESPRHAQGGGESRVESRVQSSRAKIRGRGRDWSGKSNGGAPGQGRGPCEVDDRRVFDYDDDDEHDWDI